ncbi:hypothetical protein BX600DRAFT_519111 [Xylariales sp. PMI_506]|nr:hypothetical protein BX600DRAFT_519111 [Xylariales sp. PMI_506]
MTPALESGTEGLDDLVTTQQSLDPVASTLRGSLLASDPWFLGQFSLNSSGSTAISSAPSSFIAPTQSYFTQSETSPGLPSPESQYKESPKFLGDDWFGWDDWNEFGLGDLASPSDNNLDETLSAANRKTSQYKSYLNKSRTILPSPAKLNTNPPSGQPPQSVAFSFDPGWPSPMDQLHAPRQEIGPVNMVDYTVSTESSINSVLRNTYNSPMESICTSSPARKRKFTSKSASGDIEPLVSKRTHRQKRNKQTKVEKRYRTRLNDKILALRSCIPKPQSASNVHGSEDTDNGEAPTANRMNKGDVMDLAREYIVRLESDNKKLAAENKEIRGKLELLRCAASANTKQMSGAAMDRKGFDLGRVVMALLAGIATSESLHTSDSNDGRSLFAIPVWSFPAFAHHIPEQLIYTRLYSLEGLIMPFLKLILFLAGFVYILWPLVLQASTPAPSEKTTASDDGESPGPFEDLIALRRHAFLTAAQSIWIPKGWVLELTAILLKLFKLSFRAIGLDFFASSNRLASTTEGAEAARIKAWDIAMESQLLGGDTSPSDGHMLLTLLAAWSLPRTPVRRMLMALHIRVLFARSSRLPIGIGSRLFQLCSHYFSRKCWEEARGLVGQQSQNQAPTHTEQGTFPRHLQQLLKLDVDEALNDKVIQRCSALIWRNAKSSRASVPSNPTVSAVIDIEDTLLRDPSIRSPLDAAAAWWAIDSIQEVIVEWLEEDSEARVRVATNWLQSLNSAISTSAAGSVVFAYGLVVRAILVEHERRRHIIEAIRIARMTPVCWGSLSEAQSISPVTAALSSLFYADLALALKTAMVISRLDQLQSSSPSEGPIATLVRQIGNTGDAQKTFGLLSFAALRLILEAIYRDPAVACRNKEVLEQAAGQLRSWTRRSGANMAKLSPKAEQSAVQLCMRVFTWVFGIKDGLHHDDDGSGYVRVV